MALVASVALWLLWRGPTPIDRPLMRLIVDLGPQAIGGTRTDAVLSPDGTRIAFVARDSDGKLRLATRLLEEPGLTLLAGTENAEDPFFSPDGQWLGFFAAGQMKKIPVLGGTPVFLCGGVANVFGATWGEDDTIIVATPSSGLLRLPPNGGPPQQLEGTRGALWPQFLPGGQTILVTRAARPDYGNIEVLSLRTGKGTAVARGGGGRYLPTGHLVYVRESTLYGQAFDLELLKASGVPVPLLDDVQDPLARAGHWFSFAGNGALIYSSEKRRQPGEVGLAGPRRKDAAAVAALVPTTGCRVFRLTGNTWRSPPTAALGSITCSAARASQSGPRHPPRQRSRRGRPTRST